MTTDLAMQVLPVERQEWFIHLVDECKDIVIETEFTSRWALVEGYHSLGIRILQENDNFERAKVYGEGICNAVAESLGKRPRTVYYAIQFAKMYPDLNLLKEGKNISWSHVINKYLTGDTDGKEKPVKLSPTEQVKAIKQLLQTELNKSHQESVNAQGSQETFIAVKRCEFIRYLQDQVEKITEGLEL